MILFYFNSLKNLFITLNHIHLYISENKKNSTSIFKSILRIKNGFIEKDENGEVQPQIYLPEVIFIRMSVAKCVFRRR